MIEHSPILIIVTPLIAAFLTPLLGLWKKSLCYFWTVLILALVALFTAITLGRVLSGGTIHYHLGGWPPPFGIEYVVDHLNAFVLTVVAGISLLVAISARKSVEKELPDKTVFFYTIFLLQVTGFLGIVVTGDVFNLYVFLEIASLAGYALVAVGEDGAPLASFNYVIMGTIGACFYLLGVGYLYIVTGSLNLADLKVLLPELYQSKVVLVAFVFFLVGILLKMAVFPLHIWLPDAYTHAPSAVSSLVAPLMTKVGAYVMIRILFTLFEPSFSLEIIPAAAILSGLAVIAILAGGVLALGQTDLKRMLCYVLIAEVGYIALGAGMANRAGLTGAILHIMNDAVMMMVLFLVAGAVMYKTGNRDWRKFRFLHRKMPLSMGIFALAALSVIGIPPTGGFFSKWYLLLGAVDSGNWVFAAVLLFSSLLNVIIFFRIIEIIYFEPQSGALPHGGEEEAGETVRDEAPLGMLFPLVVGGIGLIVLGLASGKIISAVIRYALPPGF